MPVMKNPPDGRPPSGFSALQSDIKTVSPALRGDTASRTRRQPPGKYLKAAYSIQDFGFRTIFRKTADCIVS